MSHGNQVEKLWKVADKKNDEDEFWVQKIRLMSGVPKRLAMRCMLSKPDRAEQYNQSVPEIVWNSMKAGLQTEVALNLDESIKELNREGTIF